MRFIRAERREVSEAFVLPSFYGRTYAPIGSVDLTAASVLDAAGVTLAPIEGETLAIEPCSASWAFLTPREVAFYRELATGRRLQWLEEEWPTGAPSSAREFAGLLFRRGLLRIDGEVAVDRAMFDDSPNCRPSHLVELLLTEKCNLGCRYCLAGTGPDMPTMTSATGRRAIDLAFAIEGLERICFELAGGEPFMQFPLMQELVDYARDHPARNGTEVSFSLQTNLTLLDDERVRWIKAAGVEVGGSVDGDPASHDRSRPMLSGAPSFHRVIRGIDLLQKHDVPFGAIVVLNRHNSANATDLVDFLVDNEIQSVKINPVAYLGAGRSTWPDFGLSNDEILTYFEAFARLVVSRRHLLREGNLRSMCTHLVSKQRTTRCLRSHCQAGATFQVVSASGDVYPCGRATQTPEWKGGNVSADGASLAAVALRNPHVRAIQERRPADLEECRSCPYRQLCQGGCAVQAFERFGTVFHRTPECSFLRRLYPYLMRWLSFDRSALAWLVHCQYFGRTGANLAVQQVLGDEAPD